MNRTEKRLNHWLIALHEAGHVVDPKGKAGFPVGFQPRKPPTKPLANTITIARITEAKFKAMETAYKALKTVGAAQSKLNEAYERTFDGAVELLFIQRNLGEQVDMNAVSQQESGSRGGKARAAKVSNDIRDLDIEENLDGADLQIEEEASIAKMAQENDVMRWKLDNARLIFNGWVYAFEYINNCHKKLDLPRQAALLRIIRAGGAGKRKRQRATGKSKAAMMKKADQKQATMTNSHEGVSHLKLANLYIAEVIQHWELSEGDEQMEIRVELKRTQELIEELVAKMGFGKE
jgi:hypothetical protein